MLPASGNVADIPGREELTLLYVDDPARLGSSVDKIGLAAEESGNLQDIDELRGETLLR
jgi:hypothetical protein